MSYYQPNTSGWILAKVEKCHCQENNKIDQKKAVLWLNRNAGMDKSVITAILLDKCIKQDMLCAWKF